MKLASLKRALALSVALGTAAATPGYAQQSEAPAAPAAVQPAAPVAADNRFQATGPVEFDLDSFGVTGQRKKLALVQRGLVAGAHTGVVALQLITGVGGQTMNMGKEDFWGIQIDDAKDASTLANPLLKEIPAAIDQQIVAMLADEPEQGPTTFKVPLSAQAGAWLLVYDELMSGSDNFYLVFRARFYKRKEGGKLAALHIGKQDSVTCEYKSELKLLSVWRANDYEAVAVEKKKAADSCVKSVATQLPRFLGIDADAKIRNAKLECKATYTQCIDGADKTADADASKKVCKAEHKQCVSDEVKPLVDMTPLGQCKVTLVGCKASVTEKFLAATPDGKPGKAEFQACTADYKKCAEVVKKQKSMFPSIF